MEAVAIVIGCVLLVYLLATLGQWLEKRGHTRFYETEFGFTGRLVYADKGDRKEASFVNQRYGVSAKPDFLFELPGGDHILVEHKNRNRSKPSDVAQIIASVLALRPYYKNVRYARLALRNSVLTIDVSGSDHDLYKSIKREIQSIKRSRGGMAPKHTSCPTEKGVCDGCSLRHACKLA